MQLATDKFDQERLKLRAQMNDYMYRLLRDEGMNHNLDENICNQFIDKNRLSKFRATVKDQSTIFVPIFTRSASNTGDSVTSKYSANKDEEVNTLDDTDANQSLLMNEIAQTYYEQ